MFYWQYSANRIFFLNEYWVFVPPAMLANYVIIRKIRSKKKRMKELKKLIEQIEKLKEQIEREKKFRRIMYLSLGLNACMLLLPRGGSTNFIDMVNTDYIKCTIDEGVRYLDDKRLRNIVNDLYKYKRRGKIIFITATAICHLVHQYGRTFLALPFAIGDFGTTSVLQTVKKGVVTIFLGGVGPLVVVGSTTALTVASILFIAGLRLAFINFDSIPTSSIDVSKELEPRIPGISEVIVVNNRDKIIMGESVHENQECWLAEQKLLNSKCKLKSTKIPDTLDSILPDLKYDDVVNMQDVTGLDRVQFTDKLDLGDPKPSLSKPRSGKEVSFLEKFGDPKEICENEKWDLHENEIIVPEKRYLRTRN